MNRSMALALGTAAGAMVATALLPMAVAFADGPSDTGADAFTLNTYIFDPFTTESGVETEGFGALTQGTGVPDFFQTGNLASQSFEVYSAPAGSFGSGASEATSTTTDLGSVTANENVTSLFNITDTGFTITSADPINTDITPALPEVGTVYNVANFGDGVFNVYEDIPGGDGSLSDGTAADVLITPFGSLNLDNLVTGLDLLGLDPGAAFDVGSTAVSVATDPLSFLGL